ncbi:DUF421 domain-containing protein [Paracoccus albus]|uniref:DUF421 domain-containing protein n=1 Tax=Paracoccus albus TaxID=3017784 RepID=UPI0022F01B16|nr:YetF domain-containing protein [Paracoccus albus]WBU61763.1 DUF421 domain-containing protein [Paracoccus albus]
MPFIETALRTFIAILLIIALLRANGLRTFSKISGFDFALTVATGSVLATIMTATGDSFWIGIYGLIALIAGRGALTWTRTHWPKLSMVIDNEPLVLVHAGTLSSENLRRARLTRDDLAAKLRGAGAAGLSDVQLMVLETSGDFAIITGREGLDDLVLRGLKWGDLTPPAAAL